MSTALALMPVMEIQQAVQRRGMFVTFVKEIMVEGTDFGKVPGTEKDTLFKPGAEKLCSFFGLAPVFELVNSVEDWSGSDDGEPLFHYQYRCKLHREGVFFGEGIGSCNSREAKYRWRWIPEVDLPPTLDPKHLLTRMANITEFEFAINKQETSGKYGKPLEYWQEWEADIKAGEATQISKKVASGKEFLAWQRQTTMYRVPNEDIFTQVNTIDKMAQKRALIAAALVTVNASEFFTQDMEDYYIDGDYDVSSPQQTERPHWASVPEKQEQLSSTLAKKGISIEIFFEAIGCKDWDCVVDSFTGTGQDAFNKAVQYKKMLPPAEDTQEVLQREGLV